MPAVFLLAAAAALLVDLPVTAALEQLKHDAAASETARTWLAYLGYLDMFELFGHGLGVGVVVLMLHQLDPCRRGPSRGCWPAPWRLEGRPTC